MHKQPYRTLLVLAGGIGVIGGAIFHRLSTADAPVLAQPLPQSAEVIRAEKFELVSDTGTRRALLELQRNGEPALQLYDEEGHLRVSLGLRSDSGPNLLLWDGQTATPRAGIAILPNGSPSVELADTDGNLRVVFGLGTDGEPVLGLFDKEGNLRPAPAKGTCKRDSRQSLKRATTRD